MILNEKNQKLAEELVSFARKNGASEVQISISSGNDFSVEVKDGEIERIQQAGSTGLGLKVIVDKRSATASSSDLKRETLEKLVLNAIDRAKIASVDEFAELPKNEKIKADINSLKLYDNKIAELTPEFKIKRAKDLEKLVLADKNVKVSGGSYFGTGTGEHIIANSNGFVGNYSTSSCSTGVSVQAGEDSGTYEDGWYDHTIFIDDLENNEIIAKKAINRLTRMMGARKVKTQNVPVIFEQGISGSLLGFLSQCLGGNSIYMKRSFLAGKLGEKIASDFVNVYDDGLIPYSPRSRPYDGEGVPTGKNKIIDNGVLKSYLLDTYSGKKLKMASTGNGSGPTNFYLEKSNNTPEDLIKSVKKGLYLVKTIGQGTVPTSGDYSKGAYGLWIEDGVLTYPVAEITISGNLGKMLKSIEMIANDVDFKHSKLVPALKISEMTISGK